MANQSEREPIHVDINDRTHVDGRIGQERVTKVTWNPNSGAALEAQARLEAELKRQYESQVRAQEQQIVPLPEQVAQLRNLVRSLVTRIEVLEQGK